MRKRKMTAKQLKYFGKRKRKTVKTKVVKLARRRGGFRRTVSRARGFGSGGGMKSMLCPIVAGVADSYLDPMLPIDGVGAAATGMFMRNNTVRDIGLYKVGISIGNIIPLPGRSGTSGGLL